MFGTIITLIAISLVIVIAARRRRGRALVPLKFSTELGLGTLAADTALTTVTIGALEHDFDVISTDLTVVPRGGTAGEGPIEFGLNMADYTVAEITECLDASPLGPYGPEMERSRRKIRHYATIADLALASAGGPEAVNDGLPIRRKMFLRIPAGKSPAEVWFVNRDSVALTTGSVMQIDGVHWGRWK